MRAGALRCRSRSKAQNVNKGLTVVPGETEYCLVMDADHHPARDHTARAVALMERYDLDVLQARPRSPAPYRHAQPARVVRLSADVSYPHSFALRHDSIGLVM